MTGQGDAPYNPHYTSPYDDLAFEMYVDREVAKIIRQMEAKKLQAVEGELENCTIVYIFFFIRLDIFRGEIRVRFEAESGDGEFEESR